MDELPDSALLHILSRLDDSADVARSQVASKAFHSLLPGTRSINLRCSLEWYTTSTSRVSNSSSSVVKPFKTVFLDLISKLESVESVSISLPRRTTVSRDDFYITDGYFAEDWLPRVSASLKSLSLSDRDNASLSYVLPVISAYCYKLTNLRLKTPWLSVHKLNPMPMLTSLTLAFTRLKDKQLNVLHKCFPNLQVLNLVHIAGLKNPKILLPKLKTCIWVASANPYSLTLITPRLITLTIHCSYPAAIHVEAPMLSQFYLSLDVRKRAGTLNVKMFEKLKTLWLDSSHIDSLLSEFVTTRTVENLTLASAYEGPGYYTSLTLRDVFTVFPNVTCLRINAGPWSKLEASLIPEDWEVLDGRKGLKTLCVYLVLVDLSRTFSYVACVLDQCVGLSEVSLLIHTNVDDLVSKSFMSKCLARWPRLKWRWGEWSDDNKDGWITFATSYLPCDEVSSLMTFLEL